MTRRERMQRLAVFLMCAIAPALSGCFGKDSGPTGVMRPHVPQNRASNETRPFARIHHSDLSYLGAFKCPENTDWAYAQGPLAYIQSRNRLVAVGKSFAELDLPSPVVSKNPALLNTATAPSGLFNPVAALLTMADPAKRLGGMTWFGGRVWLGTYEFYNVAARDNLGITSVDENWGDPRGAWRVGPPGVHTPSRHVFHANKTHSDVMVIPESWASIFTPGRRLAGGRTRGAGAFGGGKGPALYAFEANELAPHGAHLNGVPLMFFEEYGNIWPGYRNADTYHSIWIWRGNRQAVIVGARKGFGTDVYGPGPSCQPAKGWQSHPYEPRMYFIDVNELGEVAQGQRDPWSIRAYEEIMPDEMWNGPGDPTYDPGCKREWMRGWAFDSDRGILYASEPKAYVRGQSNGMIIHAWRVN